MNAHSNSLYFVWITFSLREFGCIIFFFFSFKKNFDRPVNRWQLITVVAIKGVGFESHYHIRKKEWISIFSKISYMSYSLILITSALTCKLCFWNFLYRASFIYYLLISVIIIIKTFVQPILGWLFIFYSSTQPHQQTYSSSMLLKSNDSLLESCDSNRIGAFLELNL